MRYVVALVLVAVFAACGGNSNKTLHLPNGDKSESQFRAEVRAALANPLATGTICKGLDGLSTEDAWTYFSHLGSAFGSTATPPTMPTDTATRETITRVIRIIQEECKRVT